MTNDLKVGLAWAAVCLVAALALIGYLKHGG